MRKLLVALATAGLLAGGVTTAIANPYGRGDGPGPGNSGNNSMFGLCTAYAHNNQNAKDNSPVFNEYTEDEWEELCENVQRPGGGD